MNIGCILIIIGSRGLLEVFIKLLFLKGKLEIKIAHRLNASVIRKSYFVYNGLEIKLRTSMAYQNKMKTTKVLRKL